MTVRASCFEYDSSPNSCTFGVKSKAPLVKMPKRSMSGSSETSGDGSNRQPCEGGENSGLTVAYGNGQAGNDGLRVPNDPSAATKLAGKVLPDEVSLRVSTVIPEDANARSRSNNDF